jgi:hypothetical protein
MRYLSKSLRVNIGRFAIIAALALRPGVASAYTWWQCNGTPAKWEQNTAHYQVMRCSIPQGSQRAADVIYAMDQWNAVYGMWDVFSWEWGTSDCVSIDHSNGRNEVYFGVTSEMDGASGITYVRYDSCFWWWDTQHIVEADVAFDASTFTEWGSPPCNTNRPPGARTTTVHEFGHALGLLHDDRFMNLMMTSNGEGKYCGNFVVEPHPDDANGGRFLYNSGNHSTDIGASAHKLTGLNAIALDTPSGMTSVCPGDAYTFEWSVGNMGTEGVDYNVAWVLSTDTNISLSDLFVGANFGAHEVGGDFSTWTRTINIPTSVSNGSVYYLGTILDFDNRSSERYESNNRTYLAGKIRVRSAAECGG